MTKKKKSSDDKRLNSKELQKQIIELFEKAPKKPLNPRQIAKRLDLEHNNTDSVLHALGQLQERNKLEGLPDFKFKLRGGIARASSRSNSPKNALEGIVDMTRSGSAFIQVEGQEQDIFVSARNLNSAMDGDRVELVMRRSGGRRPEGEILRVIERASEHFIGTLFIADDFATLRPDRLNMPWDVFVDINDIQDAKNRDKVVVKVTEWNPRNYKGPRGVVTTVLGKPGTNEIEMNAILINNGFNLSFPEEVLAESNDLRENISLQEQHRRRDFRDVVTFTIDPEDAKDFDDAISVRRLDNGHLEIGIHIADVSHFVLPDSELDKEAYRRSTSVYLVDRVLPMLPEKISNELCSLRPNEDKCTFSAVFEFDENDRVQSRWFGKTLIHSDRRFTYEQAQEVIEKGEGDYFEELAILNKMAKKLRKERFKKGSIDFDTDEVRFRLDEKGVPTEVYVKDRFDAHMLVEDFMLLANREVATFIHKKAQGHEIPFVYRIHDEPDPDRVAELAAFARELGFEMNVTSPKAIAASYNRLAEASEKDPGLALLQPIAIRTMAKAVYSSDNIGHYGLGFEFYSHFTSPIRRYADVLVHRILEANLGEKTLRINKPKLEDQCKHISQQERKAMTAERESIKYKQVEFMEKHLGQVFEGRISGIIDRGIFVELTESRCEGMVAFETLDEGFDVAESRLRAVGRRSGRVLKMGTLIQVRIESVELDRRQIEMSLEAESLKALPAVPPTKPPRRAQSGNDRQQRRKKY